MSTKETASSPSKEQVRNWLCRRRLAAGPLPEPEQIRRELGWGALAERTSKEGMHGHGQSKN
ncbi:hypothetical protein [Noviherbaspirillum saxi]|uniref:Uncharacterized protein n=1 Tax=Noviherbaspirillum saxi TaxID=2320863 RepID=A0A3A3FEU1_9BURK|nr:hypothetical protein [Noviherbaspirillum saxi]RJF91760.1 hypothetical protein D3871_24015 [Noviherbaspirillum saxi]